MCKQGNPIMKTSQDKNAACPKLVKSKGKCLLCMMTDEILQQNKNPDLTIFRYFAVGELYYQVINSQTHFKWAMRPAS